jgi:hypothetical protein
VSDLSLQKNDLPFLFGGNGTLTANAGSIQLDQPLTQTDSDLATLQFGGSGNTDFVFGGADELKIGVTANTSASLMGLWPNSAPTRLTVLADYGLSNFFQSHPDDLLLVLQLGASAGGDLAATFPYSVLSASATLGVGGNVGYTYIRPADQKAIAKDVLLGFVTNIRVPSQAAQAPEPGEAIAYEFGGYLKVGAGASVGYGISGTPGFSIADLQLSENYALSVIGKLSLAASLAGQFGVQVTAAYDEQGALMPGWARVTTHRKRSNTISVSADVEVNATSNIQGLPDSATDFLGALLGVNVKNWLNVLQQVHDLANFDALGSELDGLAKKFVEEWTGKAFEQLPPEFPSFLAQVQKVVDSYNNLGNSAVTLFDKYFDRLDVLTKGLGELNALTSWDQLKGEIDPELWNIVQQLTDGNPLQWILGKIPIRNAAGQRVTIPSLPELQQRVQQTLDLIQNQAHDEIRKVIALAKQSFPLDGFVQQLAAVDTVPKLQAAVNQKLGDFIDRLTGKLMSDLSSDADFKALLTTVQNVSGSILKFETTFYAKLKAAAQQSLAISMQAGYDRADESQALIDVAINLNEPAGMALYKAAAQGDFTSVLGSYTPELVKLKQGVLTHEVTSKTSFNVNVVGWHLGWHYQGFDTVITNTEQQIVPDAGGGLTVYSTLQMKAEHNRVQGGNGADVNLLLRFVGETHGALQSDPGTKQYLVDRITGMSGSYGLQLSRQDASPDDVKVLLQYSSAFGLASAGATPDNLIRYMQRNANGKFGSLTADYQVQYTEQGLQGLFQTPFDLDTETFVRRTIRKVVLGNYLQNPGLENVGWVYYTEGVHQLYEQQGPQFTNHLSAQGFSNLEPSPFAPTIPNPREPVTVTPQELRVIATLYNIEDNVVSGLAALARLIQAGTAIRPSDFENALRDIGNALNTMAGFAEGVNAIFAVFDQLVLRQVPAEEARASSLVLTFTVNGGQKTLPFLSAAAEPKSVAQASGG